MSTKNVSAEIFELEGARSRLRPTGIDPKNFLAVGPYLEAVREQQGYSVDTMAARTHIKPSYLEAIDQMAIDKLPGRSFAIGFVRSYAEALGLDAGSVVERFKEEAGYSQMKTAEPAEIPVVHAPPPPAEPSRLSFFAVLAILAFMIWCAMWITMPRDTTTPLKLDGVPTTRESFNRNVDTSPPAISPAAEAAKPEAQTAATAPVEARLIERIEPIYPPACEAGAAPLETVEAIFTITADGVVVSERVAASSNACFDRAALNALKRWRFSPRQVGGETRPVFEQRTTMRFERPS